MYCNIFLCRPKVTFRIEDGNTDDRFAIESIPNKGGNSVGKVMLVKKLDYETQTRTYKLTVVAYNADATNRDDTNFQVLVELGQL